MRHIVLATLASLLVAACPHAGGPATAGHDTAAASVAAGARAAVEQWRQAYEVTSLDALRKAYARDADSIVVVEGETVAGAAAIDAMLEAKLAHAKQVHITLQNPAIAELAPTVARVVATMTREIGDGVTTVTERGVLTLVLRKHPEGWKIVLEHYSYKRPS